jgi:hypothetical protein
VINEFSNRPDKDAVLRAYSFDDFNKFYVIPILAGFILAMNVLVYWGLLPAPSRVRFEEPELASATPKKVVVEIDPDPAPSPSVMKVRGSRVQKL